MHTNPFATPGAGDVGGMNVIVKHAAHALVAQGHHVDVLSRRSEEGPPDLEIIDGIHHYRVTAGPPAPLTKADQESHTREFSSQMLALGREWDVIHSHHWFSGAAALPVARERGIPHVQSYHSIAARTVGEWHLGEQPEGPGRVPAEALLAKNSDAIIAVSAAERDTAIDIGAPAQRVHVVTPGVDHDVFTEGADCHDPLPLQERDTVLVAARLEPLKGIDLAITTLSLIPPDRRPRLVISGSPTGGYDGYDHDLHQMVKTHGLDGDVWFAGPMSRTDLAGAMRHAVAVLIPSFSETYGLVALEAAACGTPVIAAAVGGLVDAVSHDRTGLLIDGRNPKDWASALDGLLTDEGMRRRMGQAAARYSQDFTWERMAEQWVEVYRLLRAEALLG